MDYHNDLKTTRMQATADAIDTGAGPGTLEICTAAYAAVLLTFTLSDPCGSVAGTPATLTFTGMPKQANGIAPGGTAVIARIKDSDGKIWVSGLTVGGPGSGMNVELDNVAILTGQVVNLLSGEIVHG